MCYQNSDNISFTIIVLIELSFYDHDDFFLFVCLYNTYYIRAWPHCGIFAVETKRFYRRGYPRIII